VRILAASNRDLEAMVREGKFREDLYYRLAVLTVRLPALRERTEDVPLLVAHFLAKHAPGGKVRVTPEALRRLARHGWPGNVRQLENTVVRALVLASGDVLDEECVDFGTAVRPADPQAVPGGGAAGLDLRANVDALERGLIERALAEAGGNRTRAAVLLGLSRYGLLKKLQRGVREAASGSRASSRAPTGSPRK